MFILNDIFFKGYHGWGSEWWSLAAEGIWVIVQWWLQQNTSLLQDIPRARSYVGLSSVGSGCSWQWPDTRRTSPQNLGYESFHEEQSWLEANEKKHLQAAKPAHL